MNYALEEDATGRMQMAIKNGGGIFRPRYREASQTTEEDTTAQAFDAEESLNDSA